MPANQGLAFKHHFFEGLCDCLVFFGGCMYKKYINFILNSQDLYYNFSILTWECQCWECHTTDKLWAFDNICIITWSEEIMILEVQGKSFSSHQSSLPSIFRYKSYSISELHSKSFTHLGLQGGVLGVLRISTADYLRRLLNLACSLLFPLPLVWRKKRLLNVNVNIQQRHNFYV